MKSEAENLIEQGVEHMIVRALERLSYFDVPEANECRRKLALINAKQFLKPGEAAYLLGCSDSHLRNLVKKARRGQTSRPIPFIDLDGTVSFPRHELLKWAEQPRPLLTVAREEDSSEPRS